MKSSQELEFWLVNVTPPSLMEIFRRLGGICCLRSPKYLYGFTPILSL
jgi:hypothetical protein